MKSRFLIPAAAALVLISAPVVAANANDATSADLTFYADVLPIIQEHCQGCHREGGANMGGMIAPMAFTDYQDTRPWARAIGKAVANRDMPPWDASPIHAGVFEDERVLSEEQIETVVNWARSGAAAGDPSTAPAPREFAANEGWSIGTPDLVLKMREPFFVPDELLDDTHYFPIKLTAEELPKDRWIKAVEFRPGSTAVHHIILRPVGGIAPGNKPLVYRDGYAAKLSAGQEMRWNMHYHKEPGPGTGVWDQSEVAIIFYPEDYVPEHVLQTDPLGTFNFAIPAGEADYSATAEMEFTSDALINGMMPHMHTRGTAVRYTLHYPDGSDEILLDVPKYDFNWQTQYRFKEPKLVPKGTRVSLEGWWDNSADNPNNPDPDIEVTWGEATHEEMLFGFLSYTNPNEDASGKTGWVGVPSTGD
jgi:mono/diheme cytochrome c family protein